MSDDPLAVLEAELLGAARRMAAGRSATRRRLNLAVPALAALAAVAGVVAVGAVLLLAGHRRVHAEVAQPSLALRTAEQRVAGQFAVLRRPQQSPAVAASTMRQIRTVVGELFTPPAAIRAMLVRRIVTAPVPIRVYVAVAEGRGPRGRPEGLIALYAPGGQASAAPAAGVSRRGLIAADGTDRIGTSLAVVVPDGVAKVGLNLPGVIPSSGAVRDNVAQFHAPGFDIGRIVGAARMTWYGPAGNVIRRVPAADRRLRHP
jgi:hypothetical protein